VYVCLLVMTVIYAKMDEPTEVPFLEGQTRILGLRRNHRGTCELRGTRELRLANTIEWTVLSGDPDCFYRNCSNLL